nr:E3 ubiquitin-protein ligase At1g63170-like [Tanacetum cinerariifolium]
MCFALIISHVGNYVIFGDFNVVRFCSERIGSIFNHSTTIEFNHFILEGNLWDLPLGGHAFTGISSNRDKLSKLDRFLTFDGITSIVPNLHTKSLTGSNSFILFRDKMKKLKHSIKCWSHQIRNTHLSSKRDLETNLLKLDAEIEADVSELEIQNAIWDYGSDRSPGPDGFSFGFYKRYWNILNDDIVKFVRDFFFTAKIFANWLARVLDSIVSIEQSAFIRNRQILDGPLMVNEIIDWYKRKNKSLMVTLAELDSWLFILCQSFVMKGLNVAIKDAIDADLFHGASIEKLSISHLFFADDVLLLDSFERRLTFYLGEFYVIVFRIDGILVGKDSTFPICSSFPETNFHRFWSCNVASAILKFIFNWVDIHPPSILDLSNLFNWLDESLCNSAVAISFAPVPTAREEGTNEDTGPRNRAATRATTGIPSLLVRMAIRISRARWYSFARRVFLYQNGSRSDIGSNPFNTGSWMFMELIGLVFQIAMIVYTLSVSKDEKPVWPMRTWVSGYGTGCVLNLGMLLWRYRVFCLTQVGVEHNGNIEDSRNMQIMNKSRTILELFFAIWFVMGNVWVFDSRFGTFRKAPKLDMLCISLLAWNAITYSFPFILFLFLCCFVPLISNILGYNMNSGSTNRGASEDQISKLPIWKYKEIVPDLEHGKAIVDSSTTECCICLATYKEKEEMRRLGCSHIFHMKWSNPSGDVSSAGYLIRVDFKRWQKKMPFLLSSMGVIYVLTTPIPKDGKNATMEQIKKRNKWENDDYICRGLILNVFKHTLKHQKEKLTLVELGSHIPTEESLKMQDSDKSKSNNVVCPSMVNMVKHNNSSRYTGNRGKCKHQDTKVDPNKKSKVTCWKCGKPGH